MKIKYIITAVTITFLFGGCIENRKLISPIENGDYSKSEANFKTRSNDFVIKSTGSTLVRSAEKGKVINCGPVEGTFFVVSVGEFYISYSNLTELYVKKGDVLKKGQVIGKISKSNDENHLYLSVEKDGHFISNDSIFKK